MADGGGSRKAELHTACSSNHVPFLSRPISPRPAADCATTNTSSRSHISVFGLCDGQLDCHKYIWLCSTGYNEFGSRHGNTMPASNPLRIPCSAQRTATVIFLHVNHSLIIPYAPHPANAYIGTRTDQRCVAWHDPMDDSPIAKRRMGPTSGVRFRRALPYSHDIQSTTVLLDQ